MSRTPTWKIKAYEEALKIHFELEEEGMRIDKLTDYHWRYKNVNIWPSSMKFQKIGGKVEHYEDLESLVKSLKQ